MSKSAASASLSGPTEAAVAPALLAWYDRHRRALPWRSLPGQASDPYAVWLSEIMLQQTTVAAVKPYYDAFLTRWPSVADLAAAPIGDVLQAWAGLGYYSRARNLHACATAVVADHGGRFPGNEAGLRGLPGIGPYTAAAIAAIAFGRRAVVVDGNVERVMARLFAVATPLPRAKPALHAAMDRVTPSERTGDFAQAVMDLGATICTPRNPACVICPLASVCAARRAGQQAELPRKEKKAKVPERGGAVFVIERGDGAVLIRHRPLQGLFGGLPEFPSTPWVEGFSADHDAKLPDELRAFAGSFRPLGRVEHGLTHFHLTLHVIHVTPDQADAQEADWVGTGDLEQLGFPTLMRKVLQLHRSSLRAEASPSRPDRDGIGDLIGPLSSRRQPSPAPDASRRRRRRQTGSRPERP